MARRRNKSNTTTPNDGAKHSKTDDKKNPSVYRNEILSGLRVILGKMADKDVLAVMVYAASIEEKQQPTALQPAVVTVTATATVEEATVTATATANPSAAPTTTEAANLPASVATTTILPSPQDPVIQLNRKLGPHLII